MGFVEVETRHAKYEVHFVPGTPSPLIALTNKSKGPKIFRELMEEVGARASKTDRVYVFCGNAVSSDDQDILRALTGLPPIGVGTRSLANVIGAVPIERLDRRTYEFDEGIPTYWAWLRKRIEQEKSSGKSIFGVFSIDPVVRGYWKLPLIRDTYRRAINVKNAAIMGGGVGVGLSLAKTARRMAGKATRLDRRTFLIAAARAGAGALAGAAASGAAFFAVTSKGTKTPGPVLRETLYLPGRIGAGRGIARKITAFEEKISAAPQWTFANAYSAVALEREAEKLQTEIGRRPKIAVIATSLQADMIEHLLNPRDAEKRIAELQGDAEMMKNVYVDSLQKKIEITLDERGVWGVRVHEHPAKDLIKR